MKKLPIKSCYFRQILVYFSVSIKSVRETKLYDHTAAYFSKGASIWTDGCDSFLPICEMGFFMEIENKGKRV